MALLWNLLVHKSVHQDSSSVDLCQSYVIRCFAWSISLCRRVQPLIVLIVSSLSEDPLIENKYELDACCTSTALVSCTPLDCLAHTF